VATAPATPKRTGTAGRSSDSGGVSPRDIYDELIGQGASTIQAVAIMGNMIAESGLNPEAHAVDSNGYESYGLVQWNAASYPSAATLVTGNPVKDLRAQIVFLAQTGGFRAASGGSPQAAASNFAKNYERCETCGSGGAQNSQRQANAEQVAGWAASDSWPASTAGASDTAVLTSAESSEASAECLWQIGAATQLFELGPVKFGPSLGPYCILSKSQGRAVLGAGILLIGGVLAAFGLVALGLTAFSAVTNSAPGKAVQDVIEAVGLTALLAPK